MTDPSAFQRESYRIDEEIWASLALRSGERALFLGLANDGAWVARAVEIGARVDVVASDNEAMALVEKLGGTPLRGSATMIPAREGAYDAAFAMHFLHEIDPGFHRGVIGELARVARRVAIVEPAPPGDPLGKRIAALYARAKRERGQFEAYQPLGYWRRLLALVKPEVTPALFTFEASPPAHAVAETVSLILRAMAIEDMPVEYLDELRRLAARPDAQLLPLARIVLVATSGGESAPRGAAAPFRPAPPPPEQPAAAALPSKPQRPPTPAPPPPPEPVPPWAEAPAWSAAGYGTAAPESPELPPVPVPPAAPPPSAAPAAPGAVPPPAIPGVPPSPAAPPVPAPPFGTPFALPDDEGEGDESEAGFGWSWEPPDEKGPA